MDYISEETAGKLDVSEEENRSVMAWTVEADGWNTLYIGSEGGVKAGTSCRKMFKKCKNLEKIIFGQNFDTKDVTDMSYMFWECESLRSLDVSGFDTSNVTNIHGMFGGCESLCSLNVSSFDTSSVKNMDWMFYCCSSLEKLDVGGFNTANVTDMSDMFSGCKNLVDLDVSGFVTSSVRNMESMFSYCSSLKKLDLRHFDMSGVEDWTDMLEETQGVIWNLFDKIKWTFGKGKKIGGGSPEDYMPIHRICPV